MTQAQSTDTTALPGAGTSQFSGASQDAAANAAAPQTSVGLPAGGATDDRQQAAVEQRSSRSMEEGAPAADEDAPLAERDSQAPDGAPEHYAFRQVDGVRLSDEVMGKFSEAAKALNLPQAAAQHMLDEVAPVIARQQHAAVHALNAEWVSQVKADKELGGDKLQQNLAIARRARDAFGTDGLRTLLKESPLGNHPEMIRFFVRAGQAISEDTFVSGGAKPSSGGKDAASVLYGKHS